MRTVRNGARLVLRLQNLPEVVLRKHHCVLLLGCMQSFITDFQQVSSQRQVGAMLFQNLERQKKASPLGLIDSRSNLAAVSSSQCTVLLACVRPERLVHNTAIGRAINTLRMNFFFQSDTGILAPTRPVTLVTMTCRWWQDSGSGLRRFP